MTHSFFQLLYRSCTLVDIYNDPSRQPQGYRWAVTGIELEVVGNDGHSSGGSGHHSGGGSTSDGGHHSGGGSSNSDGGNG